jgi:hypothetical protein
MIRLVDRGEWEPKTVTHLESPPHSVSHIFNKYFQTLHFLSVIAINCKYIKVSKVIPVTGLGGL